MDRTPDAAIVRTITMRRWYRGFIVVLLAVGSGSGFAPLLSNAGWELAAAFAVPATLLGGFVAIAVVRQARERALALHPLRLWAIACVPALLPLLAAFALAFAHAIRGSVRNCTPQQSVGFFVLMPLSCAAFAAAIGVVIARGSRGHRIAGTLFMLLLVGSGLHTGYRAVDGPAIFFANHFFGWFPGPLYDEAIALDAPLFYLRLLSALIALAGLLASGIFPEVGPWGAQRRPDDPPPLLFPGNWRRDAVALGFVLVALGVASSYRREFRIDVRRADVQAALGGHVRTEHFDIWYDAGLKPDRVKLLADDHELRWHTVTTYLGVTPSRTITSYVFPDEGAKKRWTGAGGTQVANPFRGEIYLNGAIYPHPVLEHELAHAVSADFGIQPFGVSSSVGLLEGIAVATSWHDTGRGSPHEQSAAMLAEGLLPPAKSFLGFGFWAGRQARSYTAAGSFVRFLGETYGMEKVRAAYAWGRVEKTFGKPVAELDAEWRAFLATIPVPPAKKSAARERFTQPSLFERPCARELARLEEDGWTQLRRNRFDEAEAAFDAWRAVDERPEPVRALFYTAKRRRDLALADELAAKLLTMEIEGSPMWWRARIQRAELAWETGRLDDAEKAFSEVLGADLGTELDREAWIKREAVRRAKAGDADFAAAALGWFDPTANRDAQVVALTSATEHASGPSRFVGAYLLGRGLLGSGEAQPAAAWLNRAVQASDGVDSPPLLAELQALRADALTRLGRLDEARAAWEALLAMPSGTPDGRSRAEDGLTRIAWLSRRK